MNIYVVGQTVNPCYDTYDVMVIVNRLKQKYAVDALLAKKRKNSNGHIFRRWPYCLLVVLLLNLACTGNPNGGFFKGHYFQIVGDSTSGKTFLSLTCLAEANINKHFEDYRFIFDDGEGGALMDLTKFFGAGVADKNRTSSNGRRRVCL